MNGIPVADALKVERAGAFLLITFNRPESRNSLDPDVIAALDDVFDRAEGDEGLRAVAIRGAGPTFCAGGNFSKFGERMQAPAPTGDRGVDPIAQSNRRFGTFLERLQSFPKPVVVAAHGAAMGGGAGLVCAADIAIACAGTRFSFTEASLGLIPAQILPFVTARIGLQPARRLTLTAERFEADEALRLGLVDFVAPDMDALRDRLAQVLDRIGRCAPGALAATKRLARRCGEATTAAGLSGVLDEAAAAFAVAMRSEAAEGIDAARGKRPPAWTATFDRTVLTDW